MFFNVWVQLKTDGKMNAHNVVGIVNRIFLFNNQNSLIHDSLFKFDYKWDFTSPARQHKIILNIHI